MDVQKERFVKWLVFALIVLLASCDSPFEYGELPECGCELGND